MSRFLPGYALSVRQPWAWAIIHGGKDVENRTKLAITKGNMVPPRRVAIHASKGMTRDEYEAAQEFMASIGVDCPLPDKLVRGAIIGSVDLTGMVKASASPWFFGPWALTLAAAEATEPLGCRGQLGVFFWESAPRAAVQEPLPWMMAWPGRPARSVKPAGDNQLGLDLRA